MRQRPDNGLRILDAGADNGILNSRIFSERKGFTMLSWDETSGEDEDLVVAISSTSFSFLPWMY